MRKLYTILMAAAVAITSSAAVRQHAVALPKRLGTPVEQKAVMGLSAAVQTSTKAVDFKTIAEVEGTYTWEYWGLLTNDSGEKSGIVTITVLNEETGEVQIDGIFSAGTGITGTIKGVVDLEAGTLTVANKQNLGPDSYGDINYFYFKELDEDDEFVDGASAAESVVATLEGSTFTFPADCIFAVGDFDDEELGWWKLTMGNVFILDEGGNDEEDESAWVDFTTATMYDGWIVPVLQYQDGTYAESENFPLQVMVKRNVEDPNLIKIVDPYMEASGFPLSGSSGAIIIDVTDPEFVLVMPGVFSGYMNGTNKVNCFNLEGYYVDLGYSKEAIIEGITSIEEWSSMTENDGVTTISVPTCRFNYPTAPDKAYTWSGRGDAMKATFIINGSMSGIEEVNVSNEENVPVEYFNIQGVRVDKPQPGTIVIRRQGSKVSKMIVR